MKSKENVNVRASERIRRMKEGYYPIRLEHPEYSVAQISEMFGVPGRTAIAYLDEIAKENGVQREELLKCPHKKHACRAKVDKEKVNEEQLLQAIQNAVQEIDIIIDSINKELEDNKNLIMEEQ